MPNARVVMLSPHGDPLGRIGEPDIGGQCVYIRELAKHLSAEGVQVRVFTRDRHEGKPPIEPFAPHASVVRIPCGPNGFIPKEDLLQHLPEFTARVGESIDGAEVLHSHYWDGGFVAEGLHTSQPWFHSTHSLGKVKQRSLPDEAKYQYADRLSIEESVYRGCDQVFALTDIEKTQIVELYHVAEEQIVVIPPGVDTSVFRPCSSKASLQEQLGLPKRLTVFALGRLDERKGLDLYLEAAGALCRKSDLPAWSFVLSAGDGSPQETEEQAKLADILERHQLQDRVIWLPVLPEEQLPLYYGASDIFVLPSRYEPFGIVMLEAMASGVPVVATNNGGPAKVIEHGVDGFLGDPQDVETFADFVESLLIDADLRHAFGQRAHQKIVQSYDWSVIAKRFRDAFGFKAAGGESNAR